MILIAGASIGFELGRQIAQERLPPWLAAVRQARRGRRGGGGGRTVLSWALSRASAGAALLRAGAAHRVGPSGGGCGG
eukprot:SAG11_NODE_1501_length_4785_cov_26.436406_2_plen_78_part_00